MRLALYQPDIPQNAGTLFRLCACLGVPVDFIEPAGFVLGDPQFRRAGMDYLSGVDLERHADWAAFCAAAAPRRLVLLSTKGDVAFHRFSFSAADTLILGRESAGVPDQIHGQVAARLFIPMKEDHRSLNVAVAGAIALGEAARQLGQFDELADSTAQNTIGEDVS